MHSSVEDSYKQHELSNRTERLDSYRHHMRNDTCSVQPSNAMRPTLNVLANVATYKSEESQNFMSQLRTRNIEAGWGIARRSSGWHTVPTLSTLEHSSSSVADREMSTAVNRCASLKGKHSAQQA